MIDQVQIVIKSGNGGSGAVSFRREKFVPFGGPDGGDGGNGGNIWIEANNSYSTLTNFRFRKHFQAEAGEAGQKAKRRGKTGQDLYILVPPGTQIWKEAEQDSLLADLSSPNDKILIARGGRGGWGNTHFATSTNRTPRFALKGEPGEEYRLRLELKLLADVGIIGLPNVGKSTLLSHISESQPKIADYPFTTLEPMLGVVEIDTNTFVVAEIPGLIEDAHKGKGLGFTFLRHIERTHLLLHLVDGTSPNPEHDLDTVNQELYLFQSSLRTKSQILVVNKLDLPEVKARQKELTRKLQPRTTHLFFISAATGEGIEALLQTIWQKLQIQRQSKIELAGSGKVFRPRSQRPLSIRKIDNVYEVSGKGVERLALMVDFAYPEARRYFLLQLGRRGVLKVLLRAGVQPGDKVRFGSVEIEWE
ncbi:MAG: GTPase ObgE [Chloroflexi bacterium]|nr:GTPase ObgE [Chloroflexota bacterium]